MKTLHVSGSTGRSDILIGERLKNLLKYVPSGKLVIVTDDAVYRHHGKAFPPDAHLIRIGNGERIKTMDTICEIYERFLSFDVDRSTFVVGIGGGIVCDITGFAASTYLRGLGFGFAATTLLAQVDASVGGKNGVNLKGYKNLIGVFRQPDFVICDPNLLKSLPEKERLNGFAEIIKHAAIGDPELFAFLEEKGREALELNPAVAERLVYDSVALKARIVGRDEKETGERRKLNFGHTLGHALEKAAGISHGEAVGIGMVAAAEISVRMGMLSREAFGRLAALLKLLGLPVGYRGDRRKVLEALRKDKKREKELIHLVLLEGIGEAVVRKIPMEKLEGMLREVMAALE